MRTYKVLPRVRPTAVIAGSGGLFCVVVVLVVFFCVVLDLMYCTTAMRCCESSSYHGPMAVPARPVLTVANKSWSLGSESVPKVERNLNMPVVKSVGGRARKRAEGPSPRPCAPRQPWHQR